MNVIVRVRFFCIRFLNRMCKLFNKTIYYKTKYGIKVLNRKSDSEIQYVSESVLLNPNELYLGIDGLKDEYSSAGISCDNSPHADLMNKCLIGDLSDSYYIRNERIGALDGRDTVFYNDSFHFEQFRKNLSQIEKDYKPVKYYVIDGIKYIADGKHRASLCAIQNRKVKCCEIRLGQSTIDYFKNLVSVMEKRPELYSKNLCLLRKIILDYQEVNK